MVYCIGCGKQIHETAVTCPKCGAPQSLQTTPTVVTSVSTEPASRNTLVLVFVALGWTLILWLAFLFIGGFIIGITHPDTAQESGKAFGQAAGLPLLLLAGGLSTLFTVWGKLPGTKKEKSILLGGTMTEGNFQLICPRCGYKDSPSKFPDAYNNLTCGCLALLMVLPAILYYFFRQDKKVCPQCKKLF